MHKTVEEKSNKTKADQPLPLNMQQYLPSGPSQISQLLQQTPSSLNQVLQPMIPSSQNSSLM
jgi:hypothetical protein